MSKRGKQTYRLTWLALAGSLSFITMFGPVALMQASATNPSWGWTGSLNTAGGSATLLQNGKVLVVGGGAELYDPETGQWSPTGNLITPRGGHIAVRLANGKVLVAGGRPVNGSSVLTSAEIYDPGTGAWSAAGNLSVPREHHTANLLADGTVLVIGGQIILEVLPDRVRYLTYNSADIYDPATGGWSSAGTMPSPHAHHASIVLANGNVLVIGGDDDHVNQRRTALFDPATRIWSATGDAISARWQPRATVLFDGKVLVAGGDGGIDAAELYNPVSGQWTATGPMATRRREHTMTLLPDGKVLAAGGHLDDEDFHTGEVTVWDTAELYDPVTGQWSATASMNAARYGHTATLLVNGRVLVAGGCINGGCLKRAELYDSDTNSIDYSQFFVRQQYLDFLGREPEPEGFQFYLNILDGCSPADTECIKYTRGALSANFFRSPEFGRKGAYVANLFNIVIGQRPKTVAELNDSTKVERPHYAEFMADLATLSTPNDDPVLTDQKKDQLASAWLARTEVQAILPSSLSNHQFVQKLESVAGVTLANESTLIANLNNGSQTRAQVLRAIADSNEVVTRFYIPNFVTMEYLGYLRRDPEDCHISSDPENCGYIFHNRRFNTPGADPDLIENFIVRGFIESPEYRRRFGP